MKKYIEKNLHGFSIATIAIIAFPVFLIAWSRHIISILDNADENPKSCTDLFLVNYMTSHRANN